MIIMVSFEFVVNLIVWGATIIIGVIAVWKFIKSRWSYPVRVNSILTKELEDGEDFAFYVRNITGEAASPGSRICIKPKNLRMYAGGKKIRGPPKEVPNEVEPCVRHVPPMKYLRERRRSLEYLEKRREPGLPGGSMYLEKTAAREPQTWRGLWAAYLDPHGADSRKKLSTSPTVDEGSYRQNRKLFGNVIGRANEIVFPAIRVPNEVEKIEVTLENIGKYIFEKKDGEWKLTKPLTQKVKLPSPQIL